MIRKAILSAGLVICAFAYTQAQAPQRHKSMMQQESEYYSQFHFTEQWQWDKLLGRNPAAEKVPFRTQSNCTLKKRVFGWFPYWQAGTETNFQWNLISDLAYFDYTVSPTTGANTNSSFAWASSPAVTAALSHGVNAEITITLFSSHSTFLASSSAMTTCINNVISLLNSRGGKGVNIDFEGMASSDKAGFTAFMTQFKNALKAANSAYELSIALYAVDWGPVFDIPNLNNVIDLYIIMGYDYYYGGSTTAGPSDPLYDFQTGYNYDHSKSITAYLKAGVPLNKLLLGVPYYGETWATTAGTAPSATSGTGTSLIYNTMRANASGNYSVANMHWEPNSFTPYFAYNSGGWHQAWIDNDYSMGKRYDVVNQRGIGGIGIWAMGYDNGYTELWTKIQDKFSSCAVIPCKDTIYDMGGPNMPYYTGEDYTYTIAPSGATSVSLAFSSFNVQAGKDTLWLYNGPSTASPLIGKYTGTTSPGTVGGTSPSMTMRFKSTGTTPGPGFQAIWVCNGGSVPTPDTTRPVAAVNPPAGWITQNFNCAYNDKDNTGGSGIEKCYYQVCDFNGTEWRSNNARGYFNDDFTGTAFNPEWTSTLGTWTVGGGILDQTDQTLSNTSLSAPLNQSLSNRYLYNWQGKIGGTGTTRRAGLHIFCDSTNETNRGNNYFVWFRVDQGVCEFYKTTKNTFSLVHSVPMTTVAGQWYDWKVIYDRTTGVLEVLQNNVSVGSYTDPSPISTGSAVSFRSGNCDWAIKNFKVYRSRATNTPSAITVGSATADMRYQNPNPSTAAGRICTIARDSALNISNPNYQDFNVDWTPPTAFTVSDGLSGPDQDTTFSTSQISANWTASTDPNSGLTKYWYAIGTSAGATNVLNWTTNGTATSVTATGLSLVVGTTYFFSIKAEDGAGLQSAVVNTDDGQLATTVTGIQDPSNAFSLQAFPNPVHGNLNITWNLKESGPLEIRMLDVSGRSLSVYSNAMESSGQHQFSYDTRNLAKGMYVLEVACGDKRHYLKLIVQ
ncbi:MAG TPA: glycosyl hydrolase family 18 protein [Bacteroidia bacterium]|jgi:spore germination protein YaaH|nr:glycosyl hydrolase family 18 protein [Bacteroidia bacterium]